MSDDLVTGLLEAADDARRKIEAALADMVLRFELEMSVALDDAFAPDDDGERAAA